MTGNRVTMAYRIVEPVFVVVHGKQNPTQQEWDAYLQYYLAHEPECARTLVITAGGGPDAQKRAATARVIQSKPTKVAIVSSSSMVFGIVTALSWFNPNVKGFRAAQIDAALEYLEVPQTSSRRLLNAVDMLRAKITEE